MDRERGVGVPHDRARRRRDAGARARRAGVRGLDTFAEVFVNGAHGADRRQHVPQLARRREGAAQGGRQRRSSSASRRRSPKVKPAYDKLGYKLPAANDQGKEMVSMWARKAPYHYGWDWGPRFVTSGIWRPVALEAWDEARLDDVQVFQNKLDAGNAPRELGIVARVVAARAGQARASPSRSPADRRWATPTSTLKPGVNDVKLGARIDKPELWWPAGLGAQKLYTLETKLATADGKARDARTTRIGLRTIEVVHERDAEGKSFFIKVNGAPVFMKGANWIPADSFVTRVTDERYRFLLQSAVDANMNMLRVWGGGIYEDDRFYDLADELGLLVWQDFMFACSMYPGDEPFVENVRHEAIENVRRLRNHPSLALWAGNNENEAAWKQWGWQIKFALPQEGAGPHLGRLQARCSTRCCPRSSRPRIRGASTRAARRARTTTRCRPTSATGATCTSGACGTPRTRTRRTPTTSRAS